MRGPFDMVSAVDHGSWSGSEGAEKIFVVKMRLGLFALQGEGAGRLCHF